MKLLVKMHHNQNQQKREQAEYGIISVVAEKELSIYLKSKDAIM